MYLIDDRLSSNLYTTPNHVSIPTCITNLVIDELVGNGQADGGWLDCRVQFLPAMGGGQVIHTRAAGPVLAVLGWPWAESRMVVPMEQSRRVPVAGWPASMPAPGHAQHSKTGPGVGTQHWRYQGMAAALQVHHSLPNIRYLMAEGR